VSGWTSESQANGEAALVAVFDVLDVMSHARMAVFDDGTLLRVLPGEPLAVWPVESVEALIVEEYAAPPALMTLRVRTTAGRTMRLRGELPGDSLLTLLRMEERLLVG
jgi:hypothetical protein